MNVYDFDNTIYNGETGVDIFLSFLKKDPSLLLFVPKAIQIITKYKLGYFSSEEAVSISSGQIVEYLFSLPDIHAEIREFWDKHIHKIKPLYFRLRSDDDLILSACPEPVLEEVCKRLRIPRYLGTEVDLEEMRIISFCFKEYKVTSFKQHFPDTRIHNFYTDSFNDKPMMEISDNVFLVKGNSVTQIK